MVFQPRTQRKRSHPFSKLTENSLWFNFLNASINHQDEIEFKWQTDLWRRHPEISNWKYSLWEECGRRKKRYMEPASEGIFQAPGVIGYLYLVANEWTMEVYSMILRYIIFTLLWFVRCISLFLRYLNRVCFVFDLILFRCFFDDSSIKHRYFIGELSKKHRSGIEEMSNLTRI